MASISTRPVQPKQEPEQTSEDREPTVGQSAADSEIEIVRFDTPETSEKTSEKKAEPAPASPDSEWEGQPDVEPDLQAEADMDPFLAAAEPAFPGEETPPQEAAAAPARKYAAVRKSPPQGQNESEAPREDEDTEQASADTPLDPRAEKVHSALEKWEQAKAAMQKHQNIRPDAHDVVAAIMKRLQLSQLGEEDHTVEAEAETEENFAQAENETLRICDVMTTKVVCVIDSTTVEQLAGLFNKRKIMAAPIVNYQNQRFMGLISMSDIFSHAFSQKMLATVQDGVLLEDNGLSVLEQPVRNFMDTEECLEVEMDCSVQEACRLMVEKQVHHLVVTRNHRVKGIFSSFDALRILAKQQPAADSASAEETAPTAESFGQHAA
ncbi:MAG: CBS domain-containing protein [Candidatus Sericytochromatia bacterium]